MTNTATLSDRLATLKRLQRMRLRAIRREDYFEVVTIEQQIERLKHELNH